MEKIKISNLTKFYTILLLQEKQMAGYELMKEISLRLGSKVSPGEMYPFLATLQKNKLVRVANKGGREKISYVLSEKGKLFATQMLGRFGGLIEIALKPHITVCTHCGCKVFEGGVVEKINGKKLKFCCMHCASSYSNSNSHSH